jgi:SagB-type dehydrogenase family enzyme
MVSTNRDIQAATDYHNASKYVPGRGEAGDEEAYLGDPPDADSQAYVFDMEDGPFQFKVYETLEPIPLPREFAPATLPALEAISRTGAEPSEAVAIPDLAALARVALLSNGLLGRSRTMRNGRVIEYRTAGGTGALYHLELYFVCGELPDLAAGVYHYGAHDHSLRLLRAGDYRQILVEASGVEPAIASAPVTMVMTSTFWRNAWYYRARAYRHAFWDGGTELAHAFTTAATLGLPASFTLGYADGSVNDLLGADGVREAVAALLALGRSGASIPPAPALIPLDYPTHPISAREHSFTAINAMNQASQLSTGAEAAAWRANLLRRTPRAPEGPLTPLAPLADGALPDAAWYDLVFKRRSVRHYDADKPLPFAAFSTVLDCSTCGFAADCLAPGAPPLHDLYLIVHNVEGLADGVYLHHRELNAVELVRAGQFSDAAAHIACDQEYAGAAHVNAYYLTDLAPVLERFGNRGYRLAQLESALYGSRLQLAAHALGLGTVGSTSWDDEVIEFFSPRASGATYLFVAVFGVKRPREAR